MKVTIDTDAATVTGELEGETVEHPLASPEGFALASRAWLRAGWDVKHVYTVTWLGRPIIQLPEDLVRIQELLFSIRPDVIVETGIAHGGSLILSASLCKLQDHGRVIGVDIDIRAHNRKAIEEHPLFPWITMIEGSSIDPSIVEQVRSMVRRDERVVVLLDSNHSRDHVLEELRAYASLVSVGSYVVVMDGLMTELVGGPRTKPDWGWNNPAEAVRLFLEEDDRFVIERPAFLFDEGHIETAPTYYLNGFLKRVR